MNIFISINSIVHCNYECVKWNLFPYSKFTDFCFHFCVWFSVCSVFPHGFLKNFYFSNKDKEHCIMSNTRKICTIIFVVKSWIIKKAEQWRNWCFQILVLEETLENPLDCMEIKSVSPKGNQPWIFIGRTQLQYFGQLMWRADSLGKKPWYWERLKAGEGSGRGWDD